MRDMLGHDCLSQGLNPKLKKPRVKIGLNPYHCSLLIQRNELSSIINILFLYNDNCRKATIANKIKGVSKKK
ncbi:hypothetical protein BpHYR1_022073 [Brachionus plicatilis]|uniref:Uncharacterized protein n=1 Tax=Brachionus plicatilis TaxID=10195 RepID=A0A3M7QJX7_BRAPC|nr:hypothetical protein BpHYR1_022073 [Brachionus plicatilis]